MIETAAIALTILLFASRGAFAFDQQDLQRLQQSDACEGCDLSDVEWPGWRLTSLDLVGSNLSGADLRAAVLTDVALDNARLNNADLTGAIVRQTSMRGADLSYVALSGTVFIASDLTGAAGLSQLQLDQACDDTREGSTQLTYPLALPACQ